MDLKIHPRKTLSSLALAALWVFTLALGLSVVPAQAQQPTQQTLPSREWSTNGNEKFEERIKRVEHILKKLAAEQEREKLAEKELEERLDKGKSLLEAGHLKGKHALE